MEFEAVMLKLEEKLIRETITKVVDTGACYVVCVCGDDGYPPMHMPYAVSRDGAVTSYNMQNQGFRRLFDEGEIVYSDDTMLQIKPEPIM